MCGITGIYDTDLDRAADAAILTKMTQELAHRGPDDYRYFLNKNVGFGFRRLSLIDLESGGQPVANEDGSVVSICNGEVFNYDELKEKLIAKGHRFHTRGDCEVLPHLYEEYGMGMLDHLNGQFALAIYDANRDTLHIARDHFGINPLFYTFVNGTFIFASEIKAILKHPYVTRAVETVGLDQVICFPGVVSPRTMFKGIHSVKSGHYISVSPRGIVTREYWDLEYPTEELAGEVRDEEYYVEQLTERLLTATALRLRADVPAGVYLSGGLDSSLIAGMAAKVTAGQRHHTFSVSFPQQDMCEGAYQRRMVKRLNCIHHEIPFEPDQIVRQLERAVYHAESPLKETHDTACLALSYNAKATNVPVILTGQGADELFAGYIGYRFDRHYSDRAGYTDSLPLREHELRHQLWGDDSVIYDNNYSELEYLRTCLYSDAVNEELLECNAFSSSPINHQRLVGRHMVHKRSYLDIKLRLADHLLADHGDRMAMAHGVELRHPFLDLNVVRCALQIPPDLKLKGYTEKYILKQAARPFVDADIIEREKFGWYSQGSPALMQSHKEWMEDMLSYDKIKRQGYFNPQTVERLKEQYSEEDFTLNQPFESDLLMIVLTFNILLETFDLPNLT